MQASGPELLTQQLSARFGLDIEASELEVDGGRFVSLRPRQLPEPRGFGVVVVRTPRRAEAYFQPDRYAGALLRTMSEADESAKGEFTGLAASLSRDGVTVAISVDGAAVDAAGLTKIGRFARIDIECALRCPAGQASTPAEPPLLTVSTACLGLVLSLLPVEEVGLLDTYVAGLPEGARTTVFVNRYERSPVNRAACLAHYGARCFACQFDFRSVYGELGEGFAEVHHRVPVSQMGGAYRIDPVRDLVPLCSNCHAMVHRTDPPMEPEALRQLVHEQRRQAAAVPALG